MHTCTDLSLYLVKRGSAPCDKELRNQHGKGDDLGCSRGSYLQQR